MNLPPPPIREQNQNSIVWQNWYRKISEFLATSSFPWSFVSKSDSSLADIETRPHSALQSVLGSGSHHLSEDQHTDLTDGGNTTLHKHTHNIQDGVQGGAADDYYHFTQAQHTDLTDAGDSALHYHTTDRARANHSGTQLAATISDFSTAADARAASAIASHVGDTDPHTQYQQESGKDVASGYAGLDSSSRVTKGSDTTDDIVIDLATKGLVLKDTQGTPHYWRVTISTLGILTTTDLGTSKP